MMSKTYLIHLLKTNKKLIIIQFASMAILWGFLSSFSTLSMFPYSSGLEGVEAGNILESIMTPYLFIFSIVYPIYFHIKEFKQNGNDFYCSLPIKKEKRYFSELLFVWGVIVTPIILLGIVISILNIHHLAIVGKPIALLICMSILAFTVMFLLNHLILMQCNNKLDAVLLVMLMTLFLIVLPDVIDIFFNSNAPSSYFHSNFEGIRVFANSGILSDNVFFLSVLFILSPFHLLQSMSNMIASSYFDDVTTLIMVIGIGYLIINVLLVFMNLISMKNKKAELNGGKTNSKWGYPLLISLVCTIPIIISFSNSYILNTSLILIIDFICYLVAIFIADRKISFKITHYTNFMIIVAAVFILRSVYISTDGFGYYKALYKNNDVKEIEVLDYAMYDKTGSFFTFYKSADEEDFESFKYQLEKFQDRHLQMYKDKNRWMPNEDNQNWVTSIEIMYYGKKDTFIHYQLTKEQLKDFRKILQNTDIKLTREE